MLDSLANFAIAQQNLSQMKKTQEETWKREDNAVQRRVADLKAAGLSPTLAAGSAASSAVTAAPQNTYNSAVLDKVANIVSVKQGLENVRKTEAEVKNINASTSKTEAEKQILFNQNILFPELKKQAELKTAIENENRIKAKYENSTNETKRQLLEEQLDTAKENVTKLQAEIAGLRASNYAANLTNYYSYHSGMPKEIMSSMASGSFGKILNFILPFSNKLAQGMDPFPYWQYELKTE